MCSTGDLVPKTVADDPALPAIEINGTKLHAEDFGPADGPLVLVLHGGPGVDYRNLLPLAALADDGYHVVFWDQRGTGLSERLDPETIDLAVYMEDLRQMIEHYAPTEPVVFIGHSWGAMYATAFINQYGDYGGRIRGEILSEPGAFTEAQLEGFLSRYQASLSLVGDQFNDAAWADQFLSSADDERADYKMMMIAMRGIPSEHEDPNNRSPHWRFGARVQKRLLDIGKLGFDWTTNLSAFTHHVLFLNGDLNEAATPESQRELAAAYPNATITTIVNVGHDMVWERPEEYLADTRAYLKEVLP